MSETDSESLKPDTGEEVARLTEKLAAADHLISRKNQELQSMGGVLAAANQKILERDEEIERLESELVRRSGEISTSSAPIAIGVEFPEPAIILTQLRAKRKKSKADLADIEAVLELLEG